MNKKTSSTTPENTTNTGKVKAPMPEGMDFVTSAGPQKWAVIADNAKPFTAEDVADTTKQIDNVIEGELLAKEEMAPDKDGEIRSFYAVKLSRPCIIEVKEDGKKVKTTAEIGDVVNIGERQKLAPLDPLVSSGARWHVYIHAAEKVTIGKGKTLWTFNIGKKMIAPAPAPAAQ